MYVLENTLGIRLPRWAQIELSAWRAICGDHRAGNSVQRKFNIYSRSVISWINRPDGASNATICVNAIRISKREIQLVGGVMGVGHGVMEVDGRCVAAPERNLRFPLDQYEESALGSVFETECVCLPADCCRSGRVCGAAIGEDTTGTTSGAAHGSRPIRGRSQGGGGQAAIFRR